MFVYGRRLVAFVLEATFVGLFFFRWDKLSKVGHLGVAWLVAIGSNFFALWIRIANGWMQNSGGRIRPDDHSDGDDGFLCGAVQRGCASEARAHCICRLRQCFGLCHRVSACYLLRRRHIELARRSITVAAAFGVAAAFSVVLLGDQSGYTATHSQKMKLTAIEAMWDTHPAPAPFSLIGFPDQAARETHYTIEIPWAMGLIGARSLNTEIPGINDLAKVAEERIRSGLIAYEALMDVRANREAKNPTVTATFEAHSADLGFALLLKKYVDNPLDASETQIKAAADDTVPMVWPLSRAFRIMVGLGLSFIATMLYFFYCASFKGMRFPRPALHLAVWMIPASWIAAELGWFISEFGRQPWTVVGVLLIGFAMGVGALIPFVGKTDVELRVAINTIGPVWKGDQVWFILGGRDICRMATALCGQLFGILPCDVRHSGLLYRAAAGVRVSFKTGRSALARVLGLGTVRQWCAARAAVRRCRGECHSGRAVPLY